MVVIYSYNSIWDSESDVSTPGTYGGLRYQSPTTRALGTITDDQYQKVYNDQAALTSKLVNDVSFISANLRKVQQQADQADENVIQQLQDFINDITVIMGGQGDTGFDFGDFKYVLEAYGALFDFIGPDGKIQTPVNLNAATQNFFNQYLFGGQNWQQAFDSATDQEIATMLDILGEVPILNQAAQQLAVIISKNRDDIDTIANVFNAFFQAFNIAPGGTFDLATFLNATNSLYTGLAGLYSDVNFGTYQPIFEQMSRWDQSVIDAIVKLSVGDWSGLKVLLPISQLTNIQPNLVDDSDFPDIGSVGSGDPNWSYDPTIGRTSLGSAKLLLDGQFHSLTNGKKIAVNELDTVEISIWIKWAGVTSSGTPIQLILKCSDGSLYVVATSALATSSGGWVQLTGSQLIPQFSGIDWAKIGVASTATATAGHVWFDDSSFTTPGTLIPQEWINNLLVDLGATNDEVTALQDYQEEQRDADATFVSAIETAITDFDGTNWSDTFDSIDTAYQTWITVKTALNSGEFSTLSDIFNSMFHINTDTGQASQNFVEGLTDFQNQITAAISGDVADSGSLAWLAQFLNQWYELTGLAHTTSVDNSNTLGIRTNKPLAYGLDNTTECGGVTYSQATDTYSLKSGTSIISFVRCQQNDNKGTIAFTGAKHTSTTPSGMYVNLYKLDFVNSKMVYLFSTTFTTSQLNFLPETWFFADANQTPVMPGDVLAVEWQSTDATNAFDLWGASRAKPPHPNAQLATFAAQRLVGSTLGTSDIPFAALGFTNDFIPYVGLEISSPPEFIYPDYPSTFTTTQTYAFQDWVNFIDLIGIGGGGGGEGELGAATGYGGTGGSWGTTTLEVGVDIMAGTSITITIGPGGAGGPYFEPGIDGFVTTFSWTKPDTTTGTLSCAGGFGGNHAFGLSHNTISFGLGASPNPEVYNTVDYYGGVEQLGYAPGNTPGGGGFGGQPFEYGTAGARGQAWLVERQT